VLVLLVLVRLVLVLLVVLGGAAGAATCYLLPGYLEREMGFFVVEAKHYLFCYRLYYGILKLSPLLPFLFFLFLASSRSLAWQRWVLQKPTIKRWVLLRKKTR
jgi:hypothetical protein